VTSSCWVSCSLDRCECDQSDVSGARQGGSQTEEAEDGDELLKDQKDQKKLQKEEDEALSNHERDELNDQRNKLIQQRETSYKPPYIPRNPRATDEVRLLEKAPGGFNPLPRDFVDLFRNMFRSDADSERAQGTGAMLWTYLLTDRGQNYADDLSDLVQGNPAFAQSEQKEALQKDLEGLENKCWNELNLMLQSPVETVPVGGREGAKPTSRAFFESAPNSSEIQRHVDGTPAAEQSFGPLLHEASRWDPWDPCAPGGSTGEHSCNSRSTSGARFDGEVARGERGQYEGTRAVLDSMERTRAVRGNAEVSRIEWSSRFGTSLRYVCRLLRLTPVCALASSSSSSYEEPFRIGHAPPAKPVGRDTEVPPRQALCVLFSGATDMLGWLASCSPAPHTCSWGDSHDTSPWGAFVAERQDRGTGTTSASVFSDRDRLGPTLGSHVDLGWCRRRSEIGSLVSSALRTTDTLSCGDDPAGLRTPSVGMLASGSGVSDHSMPAAAPAKHHEGVTGDVAGNHGRSSRIFASSKNSSVGPAQLRETAGSSMKRVLNQRGVEMKQYKVFNCEEDIKVKDERLRLQTAFEKLRASGPYKDAFNLGKLLRDHEAETQAARKEQQEKCEADMEKIIAEVQKNVVENLTILGRSFRASRYVNDVILCGSTLVQHGNRS